MKRTPVAASLEARSLNPDELIHHALKAGQAGGAKAWMDAEAQKWAARSGEPLSTTKGVISRWLHFFALFINSEVAGEVRRHYGTHMTA